LTSLLLGLLLATIALAIFVLEKSNRGLSRAAPPQPKF